ncbi:acetyltransferase [Levilactobacillus senmaizukei DSM 21775 = NBRC 103853]|uniref:Acetyltransferase n=1 Tax=Levilactobacillus senmaizukei DSM 21775 = NBRC 103853 TaxID=1423803 RepID=A0A0R2DNT8_9LACO|nr:GNAT family N-acetyltransferase [Levilactobacillus senmaizukei]KRN01850.1 acetyltransferase [Levilactobacillus senmaizukei DSM 21775 = NBRC 103853]
MINWQIESFDELTTIDLYKIAYERIRTFVIAQHRPYQEIDQTDLIARHIVGYQDGQLVAYARVFTDEASVTFGRVLTIPERRGQGLGRQLMEQIEGEIARHFAYRPIFIEAQIDKQHFYEKFGYVAEGAVFDFNGSPHIRMTKPALVQA